MLEIVDAIAGAGLRVWIDGGWGVDALLGCQTRPHEDVDVVIELDRFDEVRVVTEPMGYTLAADYLPTRAVLRAADGRQIDVHPVCFDGNGVGWQRGAAPDGSDCPYPAGGFGYGKIQGEVVPCLTPQLQLTHHLGYEPSDHDRRDMAALAGAFGLVLPSPYGR